MRKKRASYTDSTQSLGTNDSQFVVLGDLDMVIVNSSSQGNRVYLSQ